MMNQADFRFYAELNDFLSPGQRMREFTHTFANNPAIKEVDLILVNGQSVWLARFTLSTNANLY